MTHVRQLAAAAMGALLVFGSAHAEVITFTADAPGAKPNGFSAVGHPGLTFSDTIGAGLQVGNFTPQSQGNGLAVFGDDPSALLINCRAICKDLRFDFGNDDSDFLGGVPVFARLEAWLGGVGGSLVADILLPSNNNDILDQAIGFGGVNWDTARFTYTDANGAPLNLIEVVDNVFFIPEPASLALFGLTLVGLAASRRSKKA